MSDETSKERLDRELIELLNELRVALPGVQVLFAFLLAVPFQQRFAQVTPFQRDVYFVTVCSALVATALLIAPSAVHRLNFRRHDKRTIVAVSNRLAISGLAALAVSMVGVMWLIADVLFGAATTVAVTVLAGFLFVALWWLLPLRLRARAKASDAADDGRGPDGA
jgi:hypothetical protein